MQFLCTSTVTCRSMSLSETFTESIETLEQNWTNSQGYCPLKKHKMTIKPNKRTIKQCIEEKTCARGKIPQDWSNRWPADLSTGQIQRKWKVPDLDLQGLLGKKAPPPSKRMAPWKKMILNRPLPSSKTPYFRNEAKCTTSLVKISFICMRMKNDFHIKGWALNLVLTQRPGGTRKWPNSKNCYKSGSILDGISLFFNSHTVLQTTEGI